MANLQKLGRLSMIFSDKFLGHVIKQKLPGQRFVLSFVKSSLDHGEGK